MKPAPHGHTGIKADLILALHATAPWQSTATLAVAVGRNHRYVGRMLAELNDEATVDRVYDPTYTGRGKPPFLWACCDRPRQVRTP